MKKLVASILLAVSALCAGEWPHFTNFAEAQAVAKKEGKPMMVMIHTAGCPECSYMEDVIFVEEKTAAYLKANFVSVGLDFKLHEIPKQFRYIGVPHVFFTDSEGKVVSQQIGGVRGNKFLELLQKAKAKIKG